MTTDELAMGVDEISTALRTRLVLSSLPPEKKKTTTTTTTAKEGDVADGPKKKTTATATTTRTKKEKREDAVPAYDRWTLRPTSEVDYGLLGESAKKKKDDDDGAPRRGYYVTTAINYTNGPAHMGHAYEAVTSDVVARYARARGDRVRFVTGSDEHGQKIAAAAEAQGTVPISICDKYATGFRRLNQRVLVSNDDYVRTTSERHKRTARELWRRCAANTDPEHDDRGDVYLSKYAGWYNVREETFVSDTDAAASDHKDPVSGVPLKQVEEESYFFRMSRYHDRLVRHVEEHPEFVRPENHRNAVLSRLRSDPLRDLSVSRTTFSWGVPVPEGFADNHIMYVWFDALSNYLTGVDALGVNGDDSVPSDAKDHWPADVHVIGKDILWFHAVIWPCLLFSAGLPLPRTIFAHGFVNDAEGRKMSKSLGNVVDPHTTLDTLDPARGPETFRWYLCKEAPYGGELSFNVDSLVDMHNADLADTLGNLVHRATNLCRKYCDGVVPDVVPDETTRAVDHRAAVAAYVAKMDALELEGGASVVMAAFREVNGYLTARAPWHVAGDDAAAVDHRRVTVRAVLEAVYALTHLLAPFAPVGARRVLEDKLGTPPKRRLSDLLASDVHLVPGTPITVGEVLYEKILTEAEKKEVASKQQKAEAYAEAQRRKKEKKKKEIAASQKGRANAAAAVDQPDFCKMDVRVGRVTKVWLHEEADKLFCEEIDVGDGEDGAGPRRIASGLRGHYDLADLENRSVLVVCNLKAAKIVGFVSSGMVLAAKSSDGTKVELIDPPPDAVVGERVFLEGGSPSAGAPLSAAQVKKRKVWETVAAKLLTAEGGVATWDGVPIVTSKGACRAASLVGAPIS